MLSSGFCAGASIYTYIFVCRPSSLIAAARQRFDRDLETATQIENRSVLRFNLLFFFVKRHASSGVWVFARDRSDWAHNGSSSHRA